MMPQLRLWPGLALLLPLLVLPLLVVGTYQEWVARSGPLLGAADGIVLILVCCAALFAIGRGLRRVAWREPMTDVQFLVPLAMYLATSFDRVMASASPVGTGLVLLMYAAAIWLGARGARIGSASAPGLLAPKPAAPSVVTHRRD
ncbi:hypothetical protein AAFN86_05060 [Roseomonas sp. CAU 1739]|uniref:hypothetical protein n=1 Tax=Roseomonas sp. CAU 1739 TaxID=3140364 RepID=UPI00325AAE0F